MSDHVMDDIDSLALGEPKLRDGEVVVPLQVTVGLAGVDKTVDCYLTASKWASLHAGAEKAQEMIDDVQDGD